MAMVVKNNMSAVRTLNTLNSNTSALQKSLQKVSSGMKINSAQDDASGYAISERMRVRIRSLDQANQNTQNDSSLMKTAEGAVGNTVEILRALKEKAINAANDSNTDEDRQTIQKEINQFIDQIDDNALVQFNGKYLIDGSKNNASNSSKTILLNQSLQTDTLETSALTDLRNRAGDSLSIQETDKWQVSWVENGNINFTSGEVGDKTLEAILNEAWALTDADGNPTTDADGNTTFGQVKATTAAGLISSAAPAEPKIELLGSSSDGTDANIDEKIKDKLRAKLDLLNGADPTANTSYSFADLGIYANEAGDPVVGSNDGADTPTLAYDATTGEYSITGVDNNTDLYGVVEDLTDTTHQYLDSGSKFAPISVTASGTSVNSSGLTGFAAEVAGLAGITDAEINTGTAGSADTGTGTKTYTANLSSITTTLADGTTTIPKYYCDDAGDSNIIVKRTVTDNGQSGGGWAVASDEITFEKADGTVLDANSIIYNYNENYDPTSNVSGTGFDNAPDKFGKAVYTPDKTPGIAVAASTAGVDKQLSGLTISILDQDGNVKKAANAALDQFKQYQRAENNTGDMSLNFHIGSEANVAIKVGMSDMRSQALGLKGSDGARIDVYTKEHANAAINVIENALTKALDQQTTIGAIEARLEYTSTNLTTSSENVQAAESTIRDADMAKEMTNYTKSNVLLQAAQAMLAQANQNSSAVLSLLQ